MEVTTENEKLQKELDEANERNRDLEQENKKLRQELEQYKGSIQI